MLLIALDTNVMYDVWSVQCWSFPNMDSLVCMEKYVQKHFIDILKNSD